MYKIRVVKAHNENNEIIDYRVIRGRDSRTIDNEAKTLAYWMRRNGADHVIIQYR